MRLFEFTLTLTVSTWRNVTQCGSRFVLKVDCIRKLLERCVRGLKKIYCNLILPIRSLVQGVTVVQGVAPVQTLSSV